MGPAIHTGDTTHSGYEPKNRRTKGSHKKMGDRAAFALRCPR